MSELFVLKMSDRTFKLEVTEEPDKIVAVLSMNKVGGFNHPAQFAKWMMSAVEKYDTDPRPVLLRNGMTGEGILICGGRDWALGFVL